MDLGFLSKDCLSYVGAATALYLSIKAVLSIWHGMKIYILSRTMGLGLNLQKQGEWAVVTGATDGIGKGYAFELARRGMNVVLVGRSPDKLNAVSTELVSKYPVQVKTIQADFSHGESIYRDIQLQLAGLDIGVLVNNVGVSYRVPEYFTEIENADEFLRNQINVNCLSVIKMCQIVLPGMAEKKRGAIINIASASGSRTSPLLTVYSACKAFVDYLSRGLAMEYKKKGVTIQSVLPYFVATKMTRIKKPGFFYPGPEDFASQSLATLGLDDRVQGCLSHCIQQTIMDLLPGCLVDYLGMRMMLWSRGKARAKAAKAAANKTK